MNSLSTWYKSGQCEITVNYKPSQKYHSVNQNHLSAVSLAIHCPPFIGFCLPVLNGLLLSHLVSAHMVDYFTVYHWTWVPFSFIHHYLNLFPVVLLFKCVSLELLLTYQALERDQAVMVAMTDTCQELFSHWQPLISASQPKLNHPGHTPHLPDAHPMLTDTSQQG